MLPSQELFDSIDLERVERARRRTPEQRVLDGLELSEFAMKIVESGIRHSHPEADDETILRLLIARIDMQRWLEDHS